MADLKKDETSVDKLVEQVKTAKKNCFFKNFGTLFYIFKAQNIFDMKRGLIDYHAILTYSVN